MVGMLGQLNQSMQQGVPALGQVSGTSPNFQPSLQVAPPSAMPDRSPMSQIHGTPLHRAIQRRQQPQTPTVGQPNAPQAPQQGQVQIPQSEAELIIKALTSRLKTLGDHESKVRDALLPTPEAPEAK